MQTHYEIDYSLPFVPEAVKIYKPLLFVDVESRQTYICTYCGDGICIQAKASTPIEALTKWETKFKKSHLLHS